MTPGPGCMPLPFSFALCPCTTLQFFILQRRNHPVSALHGHLHRLCNATAQVRCVMLTPSTQLDAINATLNGCVAASCAVTLQTSEHLIHLLVHSSTRLFVCELAWSQVPGTSNQSGTDRKSLCNSLPGPAHAVLIPLTTSTLSADVRTQTTSCAELASPPAPWKNPNAYAPPPTLPLASPRTFCVSSRVPATVNTLHTEVTA